MIKQTAYVLHSRPYRETSAMVDLFTPDYGLIRCIARGIKKQTSKGHGLQPFLAYEIFFHGDGDLKNLDRYESCELPLLLKGDALFSGFYVNEVILRALRSEADIEAETLFDSYVAVLNTLNASERDDQVHLEQVLRMFELTLLEHMGQSYEWAMDFRTGDYVEPDQFYGFFVEQGMGSVSEIYARKNPKSAFIGEDLMALANQDLSSSTTRKTAKRLLRLALRPIIGYKPIQARELIKQFREIGS